MGFLFFKLWTASTLLLAALHVPAGSPPAVAVKKDREYYEARGEIVWEVRTSQKLIALTFDDGPDPVITPQLLDLLSKYHAKSTFFAVGSRVLQYPELAKREAAEGHELCNHTFSHRYFRKGVSEEILRTQIGKAQDAIYSVTGQKPRLFRPPGGYYNDAVVRAAKQAGFLVVLWSWHQDTRDWDSPGVQKIVDKVLNNAHPGDIVLFHDHVEGTPQTVAALEKILPELQKRGYRFVTVSELLAQSRLSPVQK